MIVMDSNSKLIVDIIAKVAEGKIDRKRCKSSE